MDTPKTELERVASRLAAKLAKLRKKDQDPVNPSNWLVPASESDLAAVTARWRLPSVYIEFLRYFSPLRVNIVTRKYYQGLLLYGASDLIARQFGYSFNPVEGEPIDDWPLHYVVIANHAGDPVVLDLSQASDGDAPVLTAMHGVGTWDFDEVAPTFLKFLRRLAG